MRKVRKAFTLVEILIVVVILGILAAIVVPQFTSATEEARSGNLESQVKTIDSALELFRARTGGYPNGGVIGDDVFTELRDQGYLKALPRNPFSDTEANATAVGDGAATDGAIDGEGWWIEEDANEDNSTHGPGSPQTFIPAVVTVVDEGRYQAKEKS
jgi:type II secretion system protein G